VLAEVETLSDHRYIEMGLASATPVMLARRRERSYRDRRWSVAKMVTTDRLVAAVLAETWGLTLG